MAMVLNAIIFNMSKLYYYYHANIQPMVVFFLNKNKNKVFSFLLFFKQIVLVSLMTMGLFFLSKGATTSFKTIYKCCG